MNLIKDLDKTKGVDINIAYAWWCGKNSMDWAKDILEKSLKYAMFNDNNQAMIEKIVYELLYGEATKSHSRNLSPEKCREIGLKIKYIEDDNELQDLILSIHNACLDYFNREDASKIYINQNGTFLSFKTTQR